MFKVFPTLAAFIEKCDNLRITIFFNCNIVLTQVVLFLTQIST